MTSNKQKMYEEKLRKLLKERPRHYLYSFDDKELLKHYIREFEEFLKKLEKELLQK